MAQYTRTTVVDSGPTGDSVKQAVLDVDADLTGVVAAYNTHDTATTSVHGFTGAKTGSGAMVGATSPTLVTPVLGVATATSINKVALTAPATSATITMTDGKTLSVSNTLTLAGTDSTTMTFPSTSATIARTDAGNTFTGHQTIEGVTSTGATGTGKFVFDTSPTLVTPTIGAATATSVNGITLTANATGFAVAGGTTSKSLTVELDSVVNQDLTTDASPTFNSPKITSMGQNWTNTGITIADLGTVTTVDINGGTVDGAAIGASNPSTGDFTSLGANILALDQNVETLSGNKTLVTTDMVVQKLDPGGADRNVTLPAEASSTDLVFIIFNKADDIESLWIYDDTPTQLAQVLDGEVAICSCDGTTWTVCVTGQGQSSSVVDVRVKEPNVTAIVKGQPVYISGATGTARPNIGIVDCTNTAKIRIVGVAQAAISKNGNGLVRCFGLLEGVDSTKGNAVNPLSEDWTAGDLLFATSGGGLTKTAVTSGRRIRVAVALTEEGSNSKLFIMPFENRIRMWAAASEDLELRMGDSDGTNKVTFKDYANNEVAKIDSNGNATFNSIPVPGDIGGTTPAVGTFTTVNATTFDTNVAAAGVTLVGTTLSADGTDAAINIAITPKGTGEVDITKVDIDGGSIDGTTIGASSAAAITCTTLNTGGKLTAGANEIECSNVDITGGTITGITDLAVADGGTGASTLTDHGILLGSGTDPVTPMTALGAGELVVGVAGADPHALAAGATTTILVGGGAADPVWTTATGTGAPVRATSPTLVTPALGTPASGTLDNCTTATATDNDADTTLATTAFAKSQDAVLAREPDQGVAMTYANSGSSGILVASNTNIHFRTGDFTLVWKGSVPDYSPASSITLLRIGSGGYDYDFSLQLLGADSGADANKLYIPLFNGSSAAVSLYSTIANTFVDGTEREITVTVDRDGYVTFYVDGVVFGSPVDCSTASAYDLNTSNGLYINGTPAARTAGTVHHAYTFNRALTAAEVLDLYRNGIAESDKWGSQTSLVTGDNSTFASDTGWWSKGAGVTIADGVCHFVDVVTGQSLNNYGNEVFEAGYKYRVNITVTNMTEGSIRVAAGSGGAISDISSNGTYSLELVAAANLALYFTALGETSCDLDNITVYKIGATLALEPENIGNGVWYDSSKNNLTATMPATGWSLTRSLKNQPVLTNILTNSQFMACSGSTLENVGSAAWEDQCASDGTANYTKGANATLVDGTGHYHYGTSSTASTGVAKTSAITTEAGKLYRFSVTISDGDVAGKSIRLVAGTGLWGGQLGTSSVYTTTATPTAVTLVFEATTTTTYLSIDSNSTNYAGYITLDAFTLYEVTPGYVAADTVAPDGWVKDTDAGGYPKLYREHSGVNTKDGNFYSLKLVSASDASTWSYVAQNFLDSVGIKKFSGRTITIGAWVKSTSATAHIRILDGIIQILSPYHSGSGEFEWLEVTHTLSSANTYLRCRMGVTATSTTAYFSQPMLVYGSSIGSGNYAPSPNERILNQANIALTGYTATTSAADGIINLEAASSGMIGKGVKAVLVKAYGKDSAAGDGVGFDVQSASGVEDGISIDTQVNNIRVQGQGWVKCDANGDIYFDHRGSGASALTVDIKVIGIET